MSGTPRGAATPARVQRVAFWIALALLALLHHDVWLWRGPRLVLGLPAGLLYHLLFCVAAAALMAWAVRFAWPPPGVDEAEDGGTDEPGGAAP